MANSALGTLPVGPSGQGSARFPHAHPMLNSLPFEVHYHSTETANSHSIKHRMALNGPVLNKSTPLGDKE